MPPNDHAYSPKNSNNHLTPQKNNYSNFIKESHIYKWYLYFKHVQPHSESRRNLMRHPVTRVESLSTLSINEFEDYHLLTL